MRKLPITVVLVTIVPTCWGQGLPDQMNFLASNRSGIHLYGVSTFFGYSVRAPLPNSNAFSRMNYGASATTGWQHLRGKTKVSARYSATYSGDVRNSDFNRLNHSLSIALVRPLGNKWAVNVSGSGQYMSIIQYLFDPSSLTSLAQSQTSMQNLGAAFSIGNFSSPQAGLMLNGGSSLASPTQAALLGGRILNYTANVSLAYQHSSRLSFHLGSVAMGGQHRIDNQSQNGIVQPAYLIPRSLGGNGGVSMAYSLSPRTTLSLSAAQTYLHTRFQRANVTSATASLARSMGPHWFLSMFGGESFTEGVQQLVGAPPPRQATWGGSIGFRTYANTLVGSYNRSGVDLISSTFGRNTNISAAWGWNRPGRSWGLHSSYSQNDTQNTGFSISGWQVSGGFSKSVQFNLALTINYSYLSSRGVFLNNATDVNVQAVRISLGWTPRLRRGAPTLEDTEQK